MLARDDGCSLWARHIVQETFTVIEFDDFQSLCNQRVFRTQVEEEVVHDIEILSHSRGSLLPFDAGCKGFGNSYGLEW